MKYDHELFFFDGEKFVLLEFNVPGFIDNYSYFAIFIIK